MLRRYPIAIGLVLVLAACSSGGLRASMQRDGRTVTVTMTDETGLVVKLAGGASGAPDPLPSAPAAWNPNGELTQIAVFWQSTACSTKPVLDLSGNALVLSIDPGPAAAGCSATGLQPNFVTLTLNAVTDVTELRLRVVGAGASG